MRICTTASCQMPWLVATKTLEGRLFLQIIRITGLRSALFRGLRALNYLNWDLLLASIPEPRSYHAVKEKL